MLNLWTCVNKLGFTPALVSLYKIQIYMLGHSLDPDIPDRTLSRPRYTSWDTFWTQIYKLGHSLDPDIPTGPLWTQIYKIGHSLGPDIPDGTLSGPRYTR